ncbi:MAG: flavin reductase family protein [Candidatus Neomarinimicrobiota bacterium]|nr:MAG: flavin reductase family protein [Candidatus Neomarinimicrobiota bacterium]
MIIDPATQSFKDNYKLMIGSILPRPIAWVSTRSPEGVPNLAPFSFFMGVCSRPPTLAFAPAIRATDGATKDTLNNIRDTKEFGVNIVSEDLAEVMVQTSGEYPPDVDEFALAGLQPEPGQVIAAPLVKASPVRFECRLTRIIPVGDGKPGSGFVVLGEIVRFHVRDDLIQEGRIDIQALRPVGRLAGSAGYCRITDTFEIRRPPKP